jgi:hypothetical protein
MTTGPESASLPESPASPDEPDEEPLDEPDDDPLLDEPDDDPLLDEPDDDPELLPLLDAESAPESFRALEASESCGEPFDPPLRPLVPTRSEHAFAETSPQMSVPRRAVRPSPRLNGGPLT